MRRRHQVDVIGALVLQLQHNLDQALGRNLKPEIARRDLVVLAIDTFERAAAKEDRARTGLARDRRLLPHMERRAGHLERVIGTAYAVRTLVAHRTATARTQMAGGRKSSVNGVGIKTCSKTTIQQLKRKGTNRTDGSSPRRRNRPTRFL